MMNKGIFFAFMVIQPTHYAGPQLEAPFQTANITREQEAFNAAMSKVRISVEWSFGDIINNFKLTDFKKTQNMLTSACGKMYFVSGLLTNAHTCLYNNNTSLYFELHPPSLKNIFSSFNLCRVCHCHCLDN